MKSFNTRYERERALMELPDTLTSNTCCSCRHVWHSRGPVSICPLCADSIFIRMVIYESNCLVCVAPLQHYLPDHYYCSDLCRKSRSWRPAKAVLPANNYLSLLPPDVRRMLLYYCDDPGTHRGGKNLLSSSTELNTHFPSSDETFFDPELFVQ